METCLFFSLAVPRVPTGAQRETEARGESREVGGKKAVMLLVGGGCEAPPSPPPPSSHPSSLFPPPPASHSPPAAMNAMPAALLLLVVLATRPDGCGAQQAPAWRQQIRWENRGRQYSLFNSATQFLPGRRAAQQTLYLSADGVPAGRIAEDGSGTGATSAAPQSTAPGVRAAGGAPESGNPRSDGASAAGGARRRDGRARGDPRGSSGLSPNSIYDRPAVWPGAARQRPGYGTHRFHHGEPPDGGDGWEGWWVSRGPGGSRNGAPRGEGWLWISRALGTAYPAGLLLPTEELLGWKKDFISERNKNEFQERMKLHQDSLFTGSRTLLVEFVYNSPVR